MPHDAYWMPGTPYLFTGVFPAHHAEPRRVVAQVHVSEERYDLSDDDALVGRIAGRGACTYVQIRPCIAERPLFLTVALETTPADPSQGSTVLGSRRGDLQLRAVGNVQGWYYPEARVFCLWEAFLDRHLRGNELITDFNLRALWLGLIAWVQETFPDGERITTPFRDLRYPTEEYQAFLRALGFALVAQAAFGKGLLESDALSYSQCLRCGQQFDGEWCPRCDVLEAREYERSTPDGKYQAWCAYRSGPAGNHWVVWTISPQHNPGSGIHYKTFEEARRSVDLYVDGEVPKMQQGRS